MAITADRDGSGYWFTNNNGAVTAFGDATYWGSAPQVLNKPVVGMAQAIGTGPFAGSSYPSGSFGYDISNFQCGNLPAVAPHHRHRRGGRRVRRAHQRLPPARRRGPAAGSTSTST